MFYPVIIFLNMMGFMEPVSSSYNPQTCITTQYDRYTESQSYHFLDIFNDIEYKTCSQLPACDCQNKSTGEFHTACSFTSFNKVPKDGIFRGTTHLTFVNNEVNIRILENDSFSTLTDLVYLDLSDNYIYSKYPVLPSTN